MIFFESFFLLYFMVLILMIVRGCQKIEENLDSLKEHINKLEKDLKE
jgi:uncharacterized protein YoxC